MSQQHFIPVGELRRLARGSYEHVVSAVDQAVQKNRSLLFGEDVEVELVGTFPGRALVLSEQGQLRRVFFERADAPEEVRITRQEAVDLPVLTSDGVEALVRREVTATVPAKLAESSHDSGVASRPGLDDAEVVERLIVDLCANRVWKTVLEEGRDQVNEALGAAELAEIRQLEAVPQFRYLYRRGGEAERFADLVQAGLTHLAARVESLQALTKEAHHTMQAASASGSLSEEVSSPALAFGADLIADLRRLRHVLSESGRLSNFGCLARLHDAIVVALPSYEVGGRFLAALARKL